MGIDAEMFARIKGRENWLPEADELSTAYDLASTLGHQNFFITIGLFKNSSDHGHHALSIVKPLKDAQEAEDYCLDRSLVGKVLWTQDGDPIIAQDDEQFVQVHLYTRYYGEDYARGNWPIIRASAEWLEKRFPDCEVWYGGDSSGVCAAPFTRGRRDQINDFYLGDGGRSYYRRDGFNFTGHAAPTCPVCAVPMFSSGGGRGTEFWNCDGCGKKAHTTTAGVRWLQRHTDHFDRKYEDAEAAE